MAEKEDKRQWYLRTGGAAVFGPVSTESLTRWAEQGRILPGHEISSDRKKWVLAESLPELAMNTYIDLGNGNLGGPFNKIAAETLIQSGRVPAGSRLLTHDEANEIPEEIEEEKPVPEEKDVILPPPQEKNAEAESDAVREVATLRERISLLEEEAGKARKEAEENKLEAENLRGELALRDKETTRIREEIDVWKTRLKENEKAYADLLLKSNERDDAAQKRFAELEKTCSLPPEALVKFETDQGAVYGLIKEEADALAQTLELERGYLDKVKAIASQRIDSMLDRRRALLRILGASPIDMTRNVIREGACNPQVANLRAQVENLHITAQRDKQFGNVREGELQLKIHQMETEAARLREKAAEAERHLTEMQNLRDALHMRERELNDERRDRTEQQEQFTVSQTALLARIETLEKKLAEQGAPEEVQNRR